MWRRTLLRSGRQPADDATHHFRSCRWWYAPSCQLASGVALLMRRPQGWSDIGMRPQLRPARSVLLAAGFFVLAVAGIVTGTAADAHHLSGLSSLAPVVTGLALGLAIALSVRAYILGIRVPSLARQVTEMDQAMTAGNAVSGQFWAGLRVLSAGPREEAGRRPGSDEVLPLPGQPPQLARWLSGHVEITPQTVVWVRQLTGRRRDLTGAHCTGERLPDRSYTEMTLTVPASYKGEILRVLRLKAGGPTWNSSRRPGS